MTEQERHRVMGLELYGRIESNRPRVSGLAEALDPQEVQPW
jgi:hypothetical protein